MNSNKACFGRVTVCLPRPLCSGHTPFINMLTCSGNFHLPSAMPPNRCNCFHLLTCRSSQSICSFSLVPLCLDVFDFLLSLQYLLPPSFPGIDLVCLCTVSALPNATLLFLAMRFFFSVIPTCSGSRSRFSPSSLLNYCSLVGPVDNFFGPLPVAEVNKSIIC